MFSGDGNNFLDSTTCRIDCSGYMTVVFDVVAGCYELNLADFTV